MGEAPRISGLQQLQRTARRVTADDGVLWLVYELPPSAFDRRTTPTLIFETDVLFRRVRNYPPDWRTLSDAELLELSWTT